MSCPSKYALLYLHGLSEAGGRQLLQLLLVVEVVVVVRRQLLQPHLTANPAPRSASSTISAKTSASVTYL
jgi:hypothetical protein